MSEPRPLAFGLAQALLGDMSPARLTSATTAIRAFCEREGYTLAEVFVSRDPLDSASTVDALIAAAKQAGPRIVAVASLDHLGAMPRVRAATVQRIGKETGASIMVATGVRQ
jgi:hypothetical protein